jgi:hypothetical protein
MSGPGTITINGNPYDVDGSKTIYGLIDTISSSQLTELSIERREYHSADVGPFTTYNFSEFTAGSIVLENDLYLIESANQSTTPAMAVTGPSGIIMSNGDSLIPTSIPGTFTITLKQMSYINELIFGTNATGTVTLGNKTYNIIPIVRPRDWIHTDSFATDIITVNMTGGDCLLAIKMYAVPAQYVERDNANYILEDFETQTVEFQCITYDTAVASALGTPNTAFGGLGIGAGGGPGNGANSIPQGYATQSNIIFSEERWVRRISIINSLQTYALELYNNSGLIKTLYTGNYGANSYVNITINKKLSSIILVGNMAIASIEYSGDPRQVIGIPDNSSVPVSFNTPLVGNAIYTISGAATGTVIVSKSTQSITGTCFIQSSAALSGESLGVTWPIASSVQLYHATLRSTPTGAMLYYVISKLK